MTPTFVIVNAAMALFDLGLAIVVFRIYRWASASEQAPVARRAASVSRPVQAAYAAEAA